MFDIVPYRRVFRTKCIQALTIGGRAGMMALVKMNIADRQIIFDCLIAAASGPFFGDADLSIVFGMERRDLLEIVARIPQIDDSDPSVRKAIGNSLNNLLRYPHGKGSEWSHWISLPLCEVEQVESRWWSLQPPTVYKSFQVFGPALFKSRYYRVVEYQVSGGGHGWQCEVWSTGAWLCANDGPGGPATMMANPASIQELLTAGVDCSPIPKNYDPMAVKYEGE